MYLDITYMPRETYIKNNRSHVINSVGKYQSLNTVYQRIPYKSIFNNRKSKSKHKILKYHPFY